MVGGKFEFNFECKYAGGYQDLKAWHEGNFKARNLYIFGRGERTLLWYNCNGWFDDVHWFSGNLSLLISRNDLWQEFYRDIEKIENNQSVDGKIYFPFFLCDCCCWCNIKKLFNGFTNWHLLWVNLNPLAFFNVFLLSKNGRQKNFHLSAFPTHSLSATFFLQLFFNQ